MNHGFYAIVCICLTGNLLWSQAPMRQVCDFEFPPHSCYCCCSTIALADWKESIIREGNERRERRVRTTFYFSSLQRIVVGWEEAEPLCRPVLAHHCFILSRVSGDRQGICRTQKSIWPLKSQKPGSSADGWADATGRWMPVKHRRGA